MSPPTPRLAVLAAPPVKVAAPGLTVDALATTALLGDVEATGTTLIVWYTTTKLLLELDDFGTVEYVMGEKFRVDVGEMDTTAFETSFAGEPGAVDVGTVTGVVSAATGQIVVYKTLVSVVTDPINAGQFVTVAGHAVIV
jgi:hypothetical protein